MSCRLGAADMEAPPRGDGERGQPGSYVPLRQGMKHDPPPAPCDLWVAPIVCRGGKTQFLV